MGVPDDPASATLAAIRAIEQAATEGPWRAVAGLWATDGGKQEIFPAVISSRGDPAKAETWLMAAGRGSPNPEANAEFAAAARTAMPRLLAAVERVLELHARQDKPVRSWDLDLRCAAHDWTRNTIRSFDAVRDCPDCRYSEYYACSHCRCPDDAWPCPTVLAITAALAGDDESDPPQTEADRRAADEALEALRAKLAGEG